MQKVKNNKKKANNTNKLTKHECGWCKIKDGYWLNNKPCVVCGGKGYWFGK